MDPRIEGEEETALVNARALMDLLSDLLRRETELAGRMFSARDSHDL